MKICEQRQPLELEPFSAYILLHVCLIVYPPFWHLELQRVGH